MVLEPPRKIFLRSLWGNLLSKVEPLCILLKPDARPVKARPCTHSPVEAEWPAASMTILIGMGGFVLRMQGVWTSLAMVVMERHGGRMVSDNRIMNKQIRKVARGRPNLETELEGL